MEETVIWEQHTVTLHRVGTRSFTNPTALLESLFFSRRCGYDRYACLDFFFFFLLSRQALIFNLSI